jgi:tetratricopeptide (TPR) repeat protein
MPRFHLPFQRNLKFIGRSKELHTLNQKLLVNQDCQKLSIVGLGGMGKTQVALQFAYTVKENWPDYSIVWVPVLSMASFEQACAEIAKTLGIPQAADGDEDTKELVKKWLSEGRAGKWLLVLDNVDDLDVAKGISRYLPKSEQGLTVYTTRTQEVAVFLTPGEDVIELEQMRQPDAEDLLKKSLIRKKLVDASTAATELLHELVYLPLAIVQAAAYLNINKDMSITDYLQQLRTTEQEMVILMSREFQDDTRYEGSVNAVATTWVVSFQQIREHNVAAANLLEFISCVEWKAIPRSLLPSVQPQPLAQMQNPISTLCGYPFLDRQEDDKEEGKEGEVRYDMHRLVHLAARIWTRKHGKTAGTTEKAVQHVTKVFPSHRHENRALWRAYLPHALRLLNNLQDCNVEGSRLCLLVGQCLRVDGRIREAVKWLEESYRWGINRQASQQALAGAYRADGQVKKAVKLLEQVAAVEEKVLEEDHPDHLASQHELAGAYLADGQVKKAVKLLEHVVAGEEKVLAEDHPSRLASQHTLAIAYLADGQVKKAVKLLEHVVAGEEKVLAEDHPDRLASQHTLAIAYLADGQVKKAVKLLEHVVAVKEKVLAEDHSDRLASQHELARAYRTDGQVKKAVKLLEQVVVVREKMQAEDHPDRLASQHTLAIAYVVDGQVKKAVKLLEQVVAVREKMQAEDHPSRLASQHALAGAYLADGQVKKAVELLEHVVAVCEKMQAEDHPDRLASQHALAGAYLADGQVKKAVELLEHVVAVCEKMQAEDHPDRLSSQHALAMAYQADGQVKKAVELLEHVVAGEEKMLAEDHPDCLASQHTLAIAYLADGQVKKAVKLLEQVVAVHEKMQAEDHPSRLASQHALARAYRLDRQVMKVLKLTVKVLVVVVAVVFAWSLL